MSKNNLPQILVTNPDGKVCFSLNFPEEFLSLPSTQSPARSFANQQQGGMASTLKRLVAKISSFLSTGTSSILAWQFCFEHFLFVIVK